MLLQSKVTLVVLAFVLRPQSWTSNESSVLTMLPWQLSVAKVCLRVIVEEAIEIIRGGR